MYIAARILLQNRCFHRGARLWQASELCHPKSNHFISSATGSLVVTVLACVLFVCTQEQPHGQLLSFKGCRFGR